jgi:replicative DNA helicase
VQERKVAMAAEISEQGAKGYLEDVIGTILMAEPLEEESDLVGPVAAVLSPDEVPWPALRTIYKAIVDLDWGGAPTTVNKVVEYLNQQKSLGKAGGAAYIHRLADRPGVADLPHFAGEVKRYSMLSAVRRATLAAHQAPTLDTFEAASAAMDTFRRWAERREDQGRGLVGVDETLTLEQDQEDRMFDVGIGDLRLGEGELNVLLAPSKMGKSAFAVQVAAYVAAAGRPVVYITLEMSAKAVLARVIGPRTVAHSRAGIFYGRIIRNQLDEVEAAAVLQEEERYPGRGNLRILYPSTKRPDEGTAKWVRAWAEHEAQRTGQAPLVVVDYLQRLRDPERADNKNLEVGENAYQLRALADDENVQASVLVISSVARGKYPIAKRGKSSAGYFRPTDEMGSWSGWIEYSCDTQRALWPTEDFYDRFIDGDEEMPADNYVPLDLCQVSGRLGGFGSRVPLELLPGLGLYRVRGEETVVPLQPTEPEPTQAEIGW